MIGMQPPFARFGDADGSESDQYRKEALFHMIAHVMEEDVGNVRVFVA